MPYTHARAKAMICARRLRDDWKAFAAKVDAGPGADIDVDADDSE